MKATMIHDSCQPSLAADAEILRFKNSIGPLGQGVGPRDHLSFRGPHQRITLGLPSRSDGGDEPTTLVWLQGLLPQDRWIYGY